MRPVYVAGTGAFLPGDPIPFAEAQAVLGPIPGAPPAITAWMERTGPLLAELLDVGHVHYALDPVTRTFTEDNVTMGAKAARRALDGRDDVDLLCYGSAHQDQMPTASAQLQRALGIETCDELAIHANCTSAYKALYLAHQLIAAGRNEVALVVSSSIASSELRGEYYNPTKLDKESLFLRWFLSDGAGAVVLTAKPTPVRLVATYIESLAGKKPSLMYNERPAYWMNPKDEYEAGAHHLRQRFRNALSTDIFQEEGGSVFLHGLRRMLTREGLGPERIRYFQVNMPTRHIVDSIVAEAETFGIPRSALYTRLDRLGYPGPPAALIGLDTLLREEELLPGDRILSFVTEVSAFLQAGFVCEGA